LVKILSTGNFRIDAIKWANPSITQSNLITSDKLADLGGKLLIVNISEKGSRFSGTGDVLDIPAGQILEKENMKKLKKYKNGHIILFSDDPSLNARIWMLLSQMGFSNLYILNENGNDEVLKYKFRPDTLNRPEF